MSPLPVVLIAEIIEQLVCESTKDLRSAALVSRDFRHEAQRVLFRSPFTIPLHADSPRGERFLDTVIASPNRLALFVRRYRQRNFWHDPVVDLDIDIDEVTHEDIAVAQKQNAPIVRKTGAALRAMKSLTHLVLIGINAPILPPGESLADVLRGCTFSLEMFSWLHPCDDHVVINEFLRTQPNLRHLGLYGLRRNQYARGVDITDLRRAGREVCPRLQSLSMPLETAELFLPGRKIRSLCFTLQYEDIEVDTQTPSMEHLANELSTVEYMEYDEAAENPPFSLMTDYLVNLKLLKIHFHSKEVSSDLMYHSVGAHAIDLSCRKRLSLRSCPSFRF